MKKSLLYLIIFVLALVTFDVSAQTRDYNMASLDVMRVRLDSMEYEPGSKVSGSFLLFNTNDFDIGDASYTVSVIRRGEMDPSFGTIIDSSEKISLPYLEPKSDVLIDFKYYLPELIKGDNLEIAIAVELGRGKIVGRGSEDFNLIGKWFPEVIVEKAGLSVLNEFYPRDTGPTIYPEYEETKLMMFLISETDIKLDPYVVIKSQFNDEVIHEEKLDPIELLAGERFIYSYNIPSEYKPGVYLGYLELLDENGINRIREIMFRYIIGGEIGTIQGVYTDFESVKKGDLLPLSINITGMPPDIVKEENSEEFINQDAKINLTVKNKNGGETIGYVSKDIKLLDVFKEDLNVLIEKNAREVIIETVLIGSEGQILDEYSMELRGEKEDDKTLLYSISTILLILIVFATGVVIKKRKLKLSEVENKI